MKLLYAFVWDEYTVNATAGSAAIDLVATQDYVIEPGEVVEIKTGLAIWYINKEIERVSQ